MKIREYAPGVPCWVDLATPDLEASKAFYGELFGWEARTSPDPNAGRYTFFVQDGREVAAAAPMMGEGEPPAWSCYVSVCDATETARVVEKLGGKVLAAPMEVLGQGTLAVLSDPDGAAFSVWQPDTFAGAGLVNEPNSFCWSELATRDPQGARRFYPQVFGWGEQTSAYGESTYTEFSVGRRTIGGMMALDAEMPPAVPSHWLVYFAVADAKATALKARDLGATQLMPLMEIEIGPSGRERQDSPSGRERQSGRFTTLADPQGANFAVIQLTGA